jgi:hypothetical protein
MSFDPFADEAMSADEFGDQDTTPEASQEKAELMETLAAENMAMLREELAAKYPAAAPLLEFVGADSPEAFEKLAYELQQRIAPGAEVEDERHPGNADPYASLEGDTALEKAKALAKESKEYGAFFSLKEAAALEAEGKVGRLLTEADRERVRQAAEFARRVGDRAAYTRLLRQLG